MMKLVCPKIKRPSGKAKQATAALHHLAKCKAIESVVGGDGNLWWFATPGCDCRTKTVDERVPEEPGSRCRKAGTKHSNKDRK